MKKTPSVFALSEKLGGMEKSLGEMFKDLLSTYNLQESSATVLNEMEILESAGEFIRKKTGPRFLSIALSREGDQAPVPVYTYAKTKKLQAWANTPEFRAFLRSAAAAENVRTDEAILTIPIVIIPLKSGDEHFGVVLFSRARMEEKTINFAITSTAVTAGHLHTLRLYQQLLKNERLVAVGQTIAGLSHDIKNILTGLRGGIDLMKEAETENRPQDIPFCLNLVERNYKRLENLVLDMVDYSKKRPPAYQKTDINRFLDTLIKDASPGLKSNTRIEESFDETLPPVSIDQHKMDRVVNNLLNNAADALGETGGIVTVATRRRDDGRFEIRVSDTGCGIPKENLGRIFEIFYSTKGHKGTGLGLAMVKQMVDDHRGEITVDSTVGQGAVFTIILPVKPT